MAGNTFGKYFTVTTCGESHGVALSCIIDGVPPQIEIDESYIQKELDRRRPGSTRFGTPRDEADKVRILSGVFEGQTTGTSIGLLIENTSQKSHDYNDIKDKIRPNHADYTYLKKYGIRDYRGGGRSSARETCMRVAAGAIAKKVLFEQFNITIDGCVTAIGPYKTSVYNPKFALENALNFADESMIGEISDYMDNLRLEHDSCGALIEVRAHNVMAGLGEPVFDKLDATIAHAMMSINAVKAVEIGDGFDFCEQKGSMCRDEIRRDGFLSNKSGGILGGISSGQDIRVKIGLKPTSSIAKEGRSIDIYGNEVNIATHGRHDPCVGIRAVVIAEAMLALVLLDAALLNRAQNALRVDKSYTI